MSDPQQPQVPPYASQPPQPPYPVQQPHAQPVYAQPAHQGYNQPTHFPSASTHGASNPMGRIGLIFGLVSIGLEVVMNVIIQVLIRTNNYYMINLFSSVVTVIILLVAVGALVFGLIGIKRVGAPHAAAGIATGIGIAVVIGVGVNFVLNALNMAFFY